MRFRATDATMIRTNFGREAMKGRPAWFAMLPLVASCHTEVQPFPELPLVLDVPSEAALDATALDSTADGPSPDLASDVLPSESGPEMPGADLPGDEPTPPDTLPDGSPETGSDTPGDQVDPDACSPVSCGLWCPFGFAEDPQGCPVCACRDCRQDEDCEVRLGCPKATCTPDGFCRCDCSGYQPTPYACPDGSLIPHCTCTDLGISCIDHPEWQCPTLCEPGAREGLPCPDQTLMDWCVCQQDFSCQPVCREVEAGSGTGVWEDACTQEVLRRDPPCIPGRIPWCGAIGTRSEGWQDDFGLIVFSRCAPRRDCMPLSSPGLCVGTKCSIEDLPGTYHCPGGLDIPFCSCDVPESRCPPECLPNAMGTWQWMNSCTMKPILDQACKGCEALCLHIGTKSEGWYSSCDRSLITYAMCGTGTWECSPEDPWTRCAAP